MALFDGNNIKLDVLKKWAYNYRWAEVPEGTIPLTAADPDYPVDPEGASRLRRQRLFFLHAEDGLSGVYGGGLQSAVGAKTRENQ